MSCLRVRLVCAALALACTQPVHAGPTLDRSSGSRRQAGALDLPTAIARARERAPAAIAALGRIGDARAQRDGAGVVFTRNTDVQVAAGPRLGDPRTLVVRAQVTQPLEPGRRGARIAVADAAVTHARATTEAELRKLDFEVATVFVEARFADLEVELAGKIADTATRAVEATERRKQAGDVSDLDVNLARIALGRARSALAAAQSERARAIGRLGVLVGAAPEEPIALAGELRPPPLALATLRAALPARADIHAIEAEARVARREGAFAIATGRPDLGLWFAFERDEGDSIVLGGLTMTLPLWNRAQGDKAAARAKLQSAERERAAIVAAAEREVADAFAAYTRAREAVDIFDRDVLPALVDSEALLERSIATGQITVNVFLVAHQEILASRREHLERQLALAKAAASARFAAGMTP